MLQLNAAGSVGSELSRPLALCGRRGAQLRAPDGVPADLLAWT